MTLEEFNALSEEEKNAYFETNNKLTKDISDLTAERDSFKAENEKLLKGSSDLQKELKDTKELNYTLARKLSTEEPKRASEDILHDMFMKGD